MKLLATVAGAKHEIPDASLSDLVAFERHFGVSSEIMADEATPKRVEWIAFLLYRGLIRSGVLPKETSFDDAVEMIEDFDTLQEEGDEVTPDPTAAASV